MGRDDQQCRGCAAKDKRIAELEAALRKVRVLIERAVPVGTHECGQRLGEAVACIDLALGEGQEALPGLNKTEPLPDIPDSKIIKKRIW